MRVQKEDPLFFVMYQWIFNKSALIRTAGKVT
jgi:hypothetical protein